MTRTVPVALARGRGYDVHVGRGLLGRVAELAHITHDRQALVVTQPPVAEHHLSTLRDGLTTAGSATAVATIRDGEPAKDLGTYGELLARCAEVPLRRSDVVVALGGGVVGDLAGFVAATYNRGIDVVQVSTTLLGQVDAAIGGKTGLNLPAGKNLVGAFHQPRAVIADVDTLATLSPRTLTEGYGEIVKYGLIRDPAILDLLEQADAYDDPDLLEELVARSAAVKAAVVVADERESGERAHLNLGHTFGHAVESLTGYGQVLHGEAVAIGTVVALELGVRLGRTDRALVERTEALLRRIGLPTRAPSLDRSEVWRVMARDKKATSTGVRFVTVAAPGQVHVDVPDRGDVDAAIDAVEATGP